MKITIELDATALVRWRGRLGHMEDGRFIVDDLPGQATGPWGKSHATSGGGRTVCGREIPGGAEPAPDQGSLCAHCVSRASYLL